jgi:hypothetical protein
MSRSLKDPSVLAELLLVWEEAIRTSCDWGITPHLSEPEPTKDGWVLYDPAARPVVKVFDHMLGPGALAQMLYLVSELGAIMQYGLGGDVTVGDVFRAWWVFNDPGPDEVVDRLQQWLVAIEAIPPAKRWRVRIRQLIPSRLRRADLYAALSQARREMSADLDLYQNRLDDSPI